MTIRDISIAFGFEVDSSSQKKAESAITSLKSLATRALTAIGISFSLTKINSLIETWYSVNKVLNTLSTELDSQEEVQNRILEAANACRLAYSDMADYVSSLVKTGSQFFSTVEDAAEFLELANKAFQLAGATDSEISSLNSVLQQTFSTGKLSASGFSTVMSACPDIVTYLSESLGITEQQVKALGLSGSITAKQLYYAFQNSASAISEAYEDLELTISDALTIIKNEFGTWLSQMNETYGTTSSLAKALLRAFRSLLAALKKVVSWFDRLTTLLGSTRRAALLLAATFAAIYVAFKWQSILTGLSKIGKVLTGVNVKLLAIVAVIWLIILAIDDLVAFVNGDSSLIGSLFEKMGIDAEELRQTIQELFTALKTMLDTILPIIQKLINSILPVLQSLLSAVFSIFSKIADVVINVVVWALELVVDILDILMPIIEMICEFLDQMITLLSPLIEAVMTLVEAVGDLIKPLLKLLSSILEPLLSIVTFLADALGNTLGGAFEFIANIVSSLISGPLSGLIDFLQQIISFISAVFTGDWETAWKALGNIPIAIINTIIGAFESLINFFINAINSITSAISSLWTWMGISAIPEIPEVSLGRISYLAQGGYIGKNQPTPVVIGDNMQEGEIVSPISKMRETVLDALHAFAGNVSIGKRQEAAQTLQQQSINKSITQNVSIYNTFEGSKDVQKTTSSAMSKSSRDITSELADAIAYMR